jgi:hypothetical protein
MDTPFAMVSEATRYDGRLTPHQRLLNIEHERTSLLAGKAKLEASLSQLEGQRRDAHAMLLRKRLHKNETVAQSLEIDAFYNREKAPIKSELAVVVERLQRVTNKRKDLNVSITKQKNWSENGQPLERIAQLLERLLVIAERSSYANNDVNKRESHE